MVAMESFQRTPEAKMWAIETDIGGVSMGKLSQLLRGEATITEAEMLRLMKAAPEGYGSAFVRNVKTAGNAIGNVWSELSTAIGRHKRTFALGLGTAAAVGLIFGRPGRLEGNEDNLTAAREARGTPAGPDLSDYPKVSVVQEDLDASSSLRVQSGRDIDPSLLAQAVHSITGATPLMSLQDYRPELHGEYIYDRFEGV
jgi:hypothetical protein